MTRCLKTFGQRALRIYKDIPSDAAEVTIQTINETGVVKDYTLTADELTALKLGYVDVDMENLINLVDDWYDLIITVDSDIDLTAGFAYTMGVTNQLYSRITVINPISPNYEVAQVYHTAKMLLDEMNHLEDMEVPQRQYQYDRRETILKEILGYA